MVKRFGLLLLILPLIMSCSSEEPQNKNNFLEEPSVMAQAPVQDGGLSDPRMRVMGGVADEPAAEEPADAEPAFRVGSGPTVIFYNGTVLTMNDNQPVASAIAVEDGVILAVGDQESVFTYQAEDTLMIDLGGYTLMPGFVDAHSHMFQRHAELGGSLHAVQEQVLSEGITTMADMGGDQGEIISQLREMEANGELRMRVSMYLRQINACGEDFGDWYRDFTQSIEPGALVHVPGVKIFLDGGSCNGVARSVGDPGDLYFTLEEATQLISDIDALGFQAAVHALGDRAIDQVLSAMSAVIGDGPNPLRHRIEHNASVRPDQIYRYSEIKPVALIFGGSVACWWNGASDRFGDSPAEEWLYWEWPSRSLIEANPDVIFGWHQDVPVFPLGSIEQLWGFVTRKQINTDGTICEPPDWALAQAIPVETALKIMTINSAYALHRDHEVGSLEVGKLADMIILSDNPLDMKPDELINLEVLVTMVNGRAEYCAGGISALCP